MHYYFLELAIIIFGDRAVSDGETLYMEILHCIQIQSGDASESNIKLGFVVRNHGREIDATPTNHSWQRLQPS